jgi:hypothetical protein
MRPLIFGLIGLALAASTSAYGQTLQAPECNAANIASTAESISKMKDSKQKALASDEISAASEALAEGKTDDCKAHLLRASLQTK